MPELEYFLLHTSCLAEEVFALQILGIEASLPTGIAESRHSNKEFHSNLSSSKRIGSDRIERFLRSSLNSGNNVFIISRCRLRWTSSGKHRGRLPIEGSRRQDALSQELLRQKGPGNRLQLQSLSLRASLRGPNGSVAKRLSAQGC